MSKSVAERVSGKREERRFLLRLVGLFLLLSIGFLLLAAVRDQIELSRFPRAKLPDGTWLVARAVTCGTNHRIQIPFSLNVRFKRWERFRTEEHPTQKDRIMIWLTHENDRGDFLDLDWFNYGELVLSDGVVVSPCGNLKGHVDASRGSSSYSGGGRNSPRCDGVAFGTSTTRHHMSLAGIELPLIRPRQGTMKMNVYDGTGRIVAKLDLPYAQLPSVPESDWQPEPLPIVKTDRNMSMKLTSVKYSRQLPGNPLTVTPEFEFHCDGEALNAVSPWCELQDPLGNVCHSSSCDLLLNESAWKLQVTIYQGENGCFVPEETKKLPLIPFPAANQHVLLSEMHTVNGIPVSVLGVGGCGPVQFALPDSATYFETETYQPGQTISSWSSSTSNNRCDVKFKVGQPFLMTSDVFAATNRTMYIVIRDQSGDRLQQCGSGESRGIMFWFFEALPTTTAIEVEIIIPDPRHVEFLIAPPKPNDITTAL